MIKIASVYIVTTDCQCLYTELERVYKKGLTNNIQELRFKVVAEQRLF